MSNKAESFIVTVDDMGENHIFSELEMNKYISEKAQIDPKTGSKQTPAHGFMVGKQILDPKYDPNRLVDLLDLYSYHADCVSAVATDVAGINYTLLPIEGLSVDENEKNKLNNILEASTPSINVHLKRCVYDRRSIGYGALEVIREGTSKSCIKRLKHIPSHTLRRHTDEKRVLQTTDDGKQVWFVIYGKNYDEEGVLCDVNADTGEFAPYNSLEPEQKANELLWTMEYAPGTQYYGRPPVIATLPSIDGDLSAVYYNTSFFKNNGLPKFAITVTGDFVDYDEEPTIIDDDGNTVPNPAYDETQTLKYKISQQIKQVIKNPHSAICITIPTESEEGNVEVKIIPLDVEIKDGQFRMYRKDVRDEVIHAHQVDPSRLGIFDAGNLNGTNSEMTNKNYKYGTVAPIKSEIEAMINQLNNELGVTGWRFSINELYATESKDKIALADFLFARGAMTIKDLIDNFGSEFGLNIEDEEDYYLNSRYLNNVPLEQVWNNSESNPSLEAQTILESLNDTLNVGLDNNDDESEDDLTEE